MKKLLIIFLSLGLVACGRNEISKEDNKSQDIVEEKPQVNDSKEEEKPQRINRTYPEREEPKKEIIEVENESGSEGSKDSDPKEKKEKQEKSEKEPDKDKDESNNQKGLTEDDYFFSYGQLVTVKDGRVVDVLNKNEDFEKTSQYIPYSNNMLVEADHEKNKVSIKKINGKDLTLIYEFKENENFDPIGLIGDKVYGIHTYEVENEEGYLVPDPKTGGLSELDLTTSKLTDFVDPSIKNQNDVASAALLGDKIAFTRYGEGIGKDLFEFDLKKGYKQEAKRIENEDEIMFLLGAKHFSGDKEPTYDLVKATMEYIRVNDNKYRYAPQSGADAIGENVIILGKIGTLTGEEKYVFDMKVINFIKDEIVKDFTKAYGYRVHDGKLYYIDENKEIKSLDLAL